MVYKYAQFEDFLRNANEKLVEFCNQQEGVRNFEIVDIIKSEKGSLALFYKEEELWKLNQ